jgi:PAS domain S-box-containing protein
MFIQLHASTDEGANSRLVHTPARLGLIVARCVEVEAITAGVAKKRLNETLSDSEPNVTHAEWPHSTLRLGSSTGRRVTSTRWSSCSFPEILLNIVHLHAVLCRVTTRPRVRPTPSNSCAAGETALMLEAMFEGSPDAVALLDPTGRVLQISDAVLSTFETTREQAIGVAFASPMFFHRADTSQVHAALLELANGTERSAVLRFRARPSDDGRVRTLASHVGAIRGSDGAVTALIAVTRDVTARDALAATREEVRNAAQQASQAKSDFLSRISHELRTPLNSILGYAQLLELEDPREDQVDSVAHILRAGRHLLQLIDEVLDLARIEAGRIDLSMEPVVLGDLVREVLELMQPIAAARNVSLHDPCAENAVAGNEVVAHTDRHRLRQVLLNLVSNAVKYNRAGGTVTVRIEQLPEQKVSVAVTDTGIGISPERARDLFTPFERLGAELLGIEGTGIGLSLCQQLVEAMSGTMDYESVVGMGSTFIAYLPEGICDDGGTTLSQVVTDGSFPPAARILYIEDNLANLTLVQRILDRHPGIEIISAMQGKFGIELAAQHLPDLILLDVHLPDMSGAVVLRELLTRPDTANIPVIVLSADATERQSTQMIQAGAHRYLTKPIDVRLFEKAIAETLAAA